PAAGRTPRWPCAVATEAYQGPGDESGMSRQATTKRPLGVTLPPPQGQAQAQARSHLVGGDPVLDAEDVGVHHAIRHHRVEVEALVYARHGGIR
ncbi:hypothetical protein N307_00892, partial [Dryobates pubescens]